MLVVGEALIDIVERGGQATEHVGGSPANVAVGVARQGHAATLLTRLGRDDRGRRIAEQVAASGAVVADASWTDAATSTARATLQADGSAAYDFDIDWSVAEPDVTGVDVVHAGSIAMFLEPGADTVLAALEAARRAGARVTLDPNIRPALVGDRAAATDRWHRALRTADLVKLSDEDAAWLHPGLLHEEALAAVATHGPRVVVMTRGAEGALALAADGIVEVPPFPVHVADTIGAGDAFMASLVSSLLDDPALLEGGAALRRALQRAAVTAGITVSRTGAQPPTRAEVDEAAGYAGGRAAETRPGV